MAEQEQLAGDALRLLAIGEVMAEIRTEGNEGFALGLLVTATTQPFMRHAKIRCLARLPISTRVGQ